jgi:hypothetical protein
MEPPRVGDLVNVAGTGPELAGIVFDLPSDSKAVVAVVDPKRGPVFRTVGLSALSGRAEEVPGDRALRLLVRRTPPPAHGSGRAGEGAIRGRSAGHARGASHRTTGK